MKHSPPVTRDRSGSGIRRRALVRNAIALAGVTTLGGPPWRAVAAGPAGAAGSSNPPRLIDFRARPNTDEYMRMFPPAMWTLDVPRPAPAPLQDFIGQLDAAGVSTAVFTGRQSTAANMWISNDHVADCANAYPERIIGIGGIDPTQNADAVREAERALGTLKLKGLSVDLFGIYPDDRRLYPIYHKCLEHNVPVILTLGPRMGPFASPAALFTVATDLPELRIVCSHAIYPRVDEFIALSHTQRNVYIEASIYHYLPGSQAIMEAAATFLQNRVIYASGFPFASLEAHRHFRNYPFTPSVLDKLLYANAARLLKPEATHG